MDFTEQSPIILSLCPGMLGLERGFEKACSEINWKRPITAAYVEIEAFIVWNLVEQMEKGLLDSAPIHTNVKTFPYAILRGKIHGVLGGYPCQPFSVAGKGKGVEDPRHLWPYIKVGIGSIRPVFCFFENVRNHLNIGYEEVKGDLESFGYEVREGIYSAEEVGAPHKRDRLFILAIRKEMDNPGGLRQQSGTEVQTGRESIIISSETVDNPINEGLQGHAWHDDGTEGQPEQIRPAATSGFPMGQGFEQWEWEEPRVKSSMGLTVNGYNFREDLLRMAGNGVVEQTAEIAFLDLLKKHNL